MGPKKQKTVTVFADANNTMIFVRKALSQLGWKVTKVDGYNVKAHTGISFTSWGEFVVVQLQIDNEHRTFLNVSSEFVFIPQTEDVSVWCVVVDYLLVAIEDVEGMDFLYFIFCSDGVSHSIQFGVVEYFYACIWPDFTLWDVVLCRQP